jgi:hypothetical protein
VLQPPDANLTGAPVASGRLGYELNAAALQAKLGVSAMAGPRNDSAGTVGAAARVRRRSAHRGGGPLPERRVRAGRRRAGRPEDDVRGTFPFASAFWARGGYAQLAYALALDAGPLRKVTLYGRYDRRHAWFEGYTAITVDRITGGLRLDLWEAVNPQGRIPRQPRAGGRAHRREQRVHVVLGV